jgi:type II secretory pathway pseudopilin PulG
MKRLSGEQGLGIFDTLLVCIIVAVMMGVVIPRYQRLADEARETALKTGLANIRQAIQVYVLMNQKVPEDLRDLTRERLMVPLREDTIFTTEYLRSLAQDSEGYPLDPFGNRYLYEPKVGSVSSTTKGYEKW